MAVLAFIGGTAFFFTFRDLDRREDSLKCAIPTYSPLELQTDAYRRPQRPQGRRGQRGSRHREQEGGREVGSPHRVALLVSPCVVFMIRGV